MGVCSGRMLYLNSSSPSRSRDELIQALRQNNPERVEMLLERHEALVDSKSDRAETPLHIASKERKVASARILLRRGADVDATDETDRTPLFLAAGVYEDNAEMIKLLVGAGARVCHAAEGKGNAEPLHAAVQNGHVNNVRALIRHGANLNAENAYHTTPAHFVLGRHAEDPRVIPVLRTLLDRGAHPDGCLSQPNGYRPLHRAVENDHWEAVCMLMAFGANPTLSYNSFSPTDWCRSCDKPNKNRILALLASYPLYWRPQYHHLMPRKLDRVVAMVLFCAYRQEAEGCLPHLPPELWNQIFSQLIPAEFCGMRFLRGPGGAPLSPSQRHESVA